MTANTNNTIATTSAKKSNLEHIISILKSLKTIVRQVITIKKAIGNDPAKNAAFRQMMRDITKYAVTTAKANNQ